MVLCDSTGRKYSSVCSCGSNSHDCLVCLESNSMKETAPLNAPLRRQIHDYKVDSNKMIQKFECSSTSEIQNSSFTTQDRKPEVIFDMFGEMNIDDLNFEDLENVGTSVDSLLLDPFPQTFPKISRKMDKADEFSSSSLSCSSSCQVQESKLTCDLRGVSNRLANSIRPSSEHKEFTPENEIEMPLLTLDKREIEMNPDFNRPVDSPSSESTSNPFISHLDVFHPSQTAQYIQGINTYQMAIPNMRQMQAPSQADIQNIYFQQVVNENAMPLVAQKYHNGCQASAGAHHAPFQYGGLNSFYSHPSYSVGNQRYHAENLRNQSHPQQSGKKSLNSKRYKLTHPSKFCHVCVRSGDQVRLAPCANVTSGLCRKAVCEKCFEKHGFGHEWAVASLNYQIIAEVNSRLRDCLPDHAWTCFHCRSQCPPSAQCKIYARTNKRRHNILKQKKAAKERAAAEKPALSSSSSAIAKPKRKLGMTISQARP